MTDRLHPAGRQEISLDGFQRLRTVMWVGGRPQKSASIDKQIWIPRRPCYRWNTKNVGKGRSSLYGQLLYELMIDQSADQGPKQMHLSVQKSKRAFFPAQISPVRMILHQIHFYVAHFTQITGALADSPQKEAEFPIRKLVDPRQENFALEPMISNFAIPRDYPNLPCFMTEISRQRNPDFCHREDVLARLDEALLPGPGQATLHGMPGIGKSEVALEFVFQRRREYDAVFWIQADNVSKMRQGER